MAATTSVSSSSICNRIYNLTFTHASISLTTTNFPQRPISHKPLSLNLKSQSFNLFAPSLHRLHPLSAAFDGFEAAQDSDSTETQQDDPQQEPEPEETTEKPQQEEEQKVSESNDSGRLYVGNLPYSMTSSQLSELFGEAGTVVSVEVSSFSLISRSLRFFFEDFIAI